MSDYQPMIRDLPDDERPRERLIRNGPHVLSNTELLAILIRVGRKGESVIRVAERLLAEVGSLRGLAQSSHEDLTKVNGIGQVKATELLAALELGKRVSAFSDDSRPIIHSPGDVYRLFGMDMRFLSQEQFRVLCLDTKCGVIRSRLITQGSLNASVVEAREVYREAISSNSASLVAIHNHPSGDPSPSHEDIELTKKLLEAGKILGIELLDHIVIGDGKYVSMKERRLM
jgi:DNA repair protein RadC